MAVNLSVKVKKGNLNKALSIFKKETKKSGIINEYRNNQYYEKPTTKRRRKNKDAKFKSKKNQIKDF